MLRLKNITERYYFLNGNLTKEELYDNSPAGEEI
jgi:hypothetical protein